MTGIDGLTYKNISGIVSLGHTTDVQSVVIDGVTYNVSHEHNEDGTVKVQKDVLPYNYDNMDKFTYNYYNNLLDLQTNY